MMQNHEVSQIAGVVMEGQGREVSTVDLALWRDIIGDLPFPLVREAAVLLLRETDRFIAPATVRQRALDIARERIRAVGDSPLPPSGLSPEAYERWQAGWRAAAMLGGDSQEIARAGLAAIDMTPDDLPALSSSVPDLHLPRPADGPRPLVSTVVHADHRNDRPAPYGHGGGVVPPPLF